jgi:hypothetical protein
VFKARFIRSIELTEKSRRDEFQVKFSIFWKLDSSNVINNYFRTPPEKELFVLRHNLHSPTIYVRSWKIHEKMVNDYIAEHWNELWSDTNNNFASEMSDFE